MVLPIKPFLTAGTAHLFLSIHSGDLHNLTFINIDVIRIVIRNTLVGGNSSVSLEPGSALDTIIAFGFMYLAVGHSGCPCLAKLRRFGAC